MAESFIIQPLKKGRKDFPPSRLKKGDFILSSESYYSSSFSSLSEKLLCKSKSVACCQFNLDGMTSACSLQWQRERDREVEGGSWTFNLLSVPNYLSLTHLSAICQHLTTHLLYPSVCFMERSFYLCRKDKCVSYLSCCKSSLASCIHPPNTHFSIPSFFALLYLPLVCTVPSLPSSSLSPPARSFPRTACSQHPLSDWLIGIKGPVALLSTWLNSIFATTLSSFPPLLRRLTVFASRTYRTSHAHAAVWKTLSWHKMLTCTYTSLKSGWGCLLCCMCDTSLIRLTKSACL